jgi:hypothetical protein
MKTKHILSFCLLLLVTAFIGIGTQEKTGINPIVSMIVLTVAAIIISKSSILKGVLAAGVFGNLLFEDGTDNMPGFTEIAYIAFRGDIATYPTLNQSPTTAAEKIRLNGEYVMEAGKKFWQFYSTKNKSSAKSDAQGEDDCRSFKNSGKLFYPGTQEECLAFAASIKNQRGVVIMVEPSGERKVFGTKLLPVYFKVSIAYGETVTGAKGMTLEWECDSNEPGYTFRGSIPVTEGTVDFGS